MRQKTVSRKGRKLLGAVLNGQRGEGIAHTVSSVLFFDNKREEDGEGQRNEKYTSYS